MKITWFLLGFLFAPIVGEVVLHPYIYWLLGFLLSCVWKCMSFVHLLMVSLSYILTVRAIHLFCILPVYLCVLKTYSSRLSLVFFFPLPYLRYLVSYKNVLTAYKSNLSFFLLHAFCIWCIVQPLRLKKHL